MLDGVAEDRFAHLAGLRIEPKADLIVPDIPETVVVACDPDQAMNYQRGDTFEEGSEHAALESPKSAAVYCRKIRFGANASCRVL